MVNQTPSPTPLPSADQPPSSTPLVITTRTWIAAIFLLPLIGLLLGAITTVIGSAIFTVYEQASVRPFGDLLELLTSIVFSLINVLAVAGSAITPGARVGIYSGSTTALVVVLLALVSGQIRIPLRPLTAIALALAGAAGAWYGVITNNPATGEGALIAYVIGGTLFGLLAAQSVLPNKA